jgi:hypothetical protein
MPKELPTLEGRTIVAVRKMRPAEAKREGWDLRWAHGAPPVLVLDDGQVIYPSQDDEGNGPGALFGAYRGSMFRIMAPR